jgi:sulfur-oxidizing protein SoxY
MERRKFLGLGLAAVALVPASLSAIDFRATKPEAWEAKTVADAIKALYGDIKPEESGITLNVPKIASNGGAVPVKVKSDIAMKSLTILQDANPEAAVATYTMDENTIIDLSVKIKMGKSGSITVVGEGQDGKFYSVTKKLEVALGGCEG